VRVEKQKNDWMLLSNRIYQIFGGSALVAQLIQQLEIHFYGGRHDHRPSVFVARPEPPPLNSFDGLLIET